MIVTGPNCPAIDVEDGLDALISLFLGPEFGDALEREHARRSVKIDLRVPAVGYIEEQDTLDGYPAVELVVGPTEQPDADSPTIRHEVSVQWTVNGTNTETMQRELLRLTAATRKLLEPGTLMPLVGGMFVTDRTDRGPVTGGRDQKYLKSAAVRVFWTVHGQE